MLQDQRVQQILNHISPGERDEVEEFLVGNPLLIGKILENFEQKKKIFASGDKEALQKLLEEERQMVASV